MHVPDIELYVPAGQAVQAPADAPPHPFRYSPFAHDDASQMEHSVTAVRRRAQGFSCMKSKKDINQVIKQACSHHDRLHR
jgi:hypothetical protein